MKAGKVLFTVFVVFFNWSCKHVIAVTRIRDKDIELEVKNISNGQEGPGTLNYAVRLLPDKQLLSGRDNKLTTALWYQMDSCFYLQAGSKKIYSTITQPIANGVAGSFEYYVSFEMPNSPAGKINLVYADRYINHKKYILSLPQ